MKTQKRTTLYGEDYVGRLGTWQDLWEYAHCQYTSYGSVGRDRLKIDLVEWFESEENEDYLLVSDDNYYYVLVGAGEVDPVIYEKSDIDRHRIGEIGGVLPIVRGEGWSVECGREEV